MNDMTLDYHLMHPDGDSIWKLKPTNQGFLEAMESRIWEPDQH